MTVEPVAGVGERKTLLATVFDLGCLICYTRYARRPRRLVAAGSLPACALSLLCSKASAGPRLEQDWHG